MLNNTLNELISFVLDNNGYLNKGIELEFNRPEKEIFFNDNWGNYFYLRLPNDANFINGGEYIVSECNPGIGMAATIIMVVIMRNADPGKLMQNMVSTLAKFGHNMTMANAVFRKETVIQQELSDKGKEVIDGALQRIPKDMTIIKITFGIADIVPQIKLDCIENPCKIC